MPGHAAMDDLVKGGQSEFGGAAIAFFNAVPTASAPGYAVGCVAIRVGAGNIDAILYVNTGTAAAATWTAIDLTAA